MHFISSISDSAMGGKRGRGKDSGGGYEDQYGGGWSGGHRDHSSGPGGGGGGGVGGMTGGGGAGGGKSGSGVTFQRQLPKFLQQHAHLLQRDEGQDDSKKAWEDYGYSDELAKYGDEDDIAGNARRGLGSNPGGNQQPGAFSDVEDRERKQEMAKVEKGKGNRAFSEKRYEDAIRSFTRCIELDPNDKVFYSNRSAAHTATKDFKAALKDGESAVRLANDWVKGHIRVGAASMGLKRYTDARESYERALKLDEDNDQIKMNLKEAAEKEEQSIKSGTIIFAMKRKRDEDGKKSAVGAGKKVKNKTLLSFNEEEDD